MHLIVALLISMFILPPHPLAPTVRFLGNCPKKPNQEINGKLASISVTDGPYQEVLYLGPKGEIMFWTNANICFTDIQLPKEMQ